MFSKKVQEAKVAYTFDDFLLTPNASYVEPKDIDTKIKLGKDIEYTNFKCCYGYCY